MTCSVLQNYPNPCSICEVPTEHVTFEAGALVWVCEEHCPACQSRQTQAPLFGGGR